MEKRKKIRIINIFAMVCISAFLNSAKAIPVVYSGYDIGSTSLAGSPNATAAAAAFDLAAGPLALVDFESALPVGISISGGFVGDESSSCFTAALHCYATSGTNVYFNNGATFDFSTPIDSFGAYWTGWQLGGQTLTLEYSGGGTEVLNMPTGNSLGGTVFFGFTDIGASITNITYFAGSGPIDAVGLDDVRFGRANVPEPSILALMGAGLAGIGFTRRRRKT